ncbi:MAG: ribosome recycling factor [Armatimonadetes bacterium]|nr:ribosome recycling factor [Armatimonadota bacterium]
MDALIEDAERRMKSAIDAMLHDFATYRTGRASPAILDRVHVDYYGTETPINQVANVSIPDARTIAIQPWERNMVAVIEKALLKSDLGINPTNDGTVIRLVMPMMSEERRRDLAKQVSARAEQAIIAIRNVRRDAIHHEQAKLKAKEINEDELKSFENKIQKSTDKFVEEAHTLQKKKEAELMEV